MLTTSQLAKQLGLSRQTVSYALNGRTDRISEEVRARVLNASVKLGCRPNSYARAMRKGQFGAITLLLSTNAYRSELPAPMLDGIHDALSGHDLHLMVARLPDAKLTSEGFVPKVLREYSSDGLLINYTDHIPQTMLELIEQNGLPSIWMNTMLPQSCVHPDDQEAGRDLTAHLIGLGHREIAYVQSVDFGSHYSTTARCQGYRRAMLEAGLVPRVMANLDGAHLEGPELRQARRHLKHRLAERLEREPVTGVVAYGSEEAFAAIRAAQLRGLAPMQQFVAGTFDEAAVEFDEWALPTMLVPNREMGQTAVALLQQAITANHVSHPPVPIPFTLVDSNGRAATHGSLKTNL